MTTDPIDYNLNLFGVLEREFVIRDIDTISALRLQSCHRITIVGGRYDCALLRPEIFGCSDIRFYGTEFFGAADGVRGFAGVTVGASGVKAKSCQRIRFIGCTFHGLNSALQIGASSDVVVEGCSLRENQTDNMQFSAITGAVIRGNNVLGCYGSCHNIAHGDGIQFYSETTTTPSTNILIDGNIISTVGTLNGIQGMMIYDEAGLGCSGLRIRRNVIRIGHEHAIYVRNWSDVKIEDNQIIHDPDAKVYATSDPASGYNLTPLITTVNCAIAS